MVFGTMLILATVIVLVDPPRSMKHEMTGHLTPSLTFMPRPLEIEAQTDEEAWRSAEPDETYLDPPPPPLSKKAMQKKRIEAKKRRLKEKGQRLRRRLGIMQSKDGQEVEDDKLADDTDSSIESSDSEYDEEYEEHLRAEYLEPRIFARDRDFARKYALSTHDLLCRYMVKATTAELADDDSVISSILYKMIMDDMWQVLAEMRLDLDHLDGEFGSGLLRQLVEVYGNKVLQNMNWARSTLQELDEWTRHMANTCKILHCSADLAEELAELRASVAELRSRTDSTVSLLSASMAIAQSTRVIEQTSGINKLTELAFVFVPISFVTAAFSMQVRELTESSPPLWTWGVALTSIMVVTYLIRSMIRSPSFRMLGMTIRATIINRYSSHEEASAAKQFGTVSTRAVVKFVCLATVGVSLIMVVVLLLCFAYFMISYGIWMGTAATAMYFIITRWGELAVIIPCFLSLPLSLLGWRLVNFWDKELLDWATRLVERGAVYLSMIVPTKDEVEDDDLAMEGVKTYARQALVLMT
jgi:Mg2+ and Co2+ transporter CorA